jgi:hypothetical protein
MRERQSQIKLTDARQQAEVIGYHQEAEQFWEEKLAHANAD